MPEIALLIFFTSLVTFIPRVLPILFLSRRSLPRPVVLWLSYVPVAVLAALLAPALFTPNGAVNLSFVENPVFWISIPVFIIAFYTRNLFATVLSGMVLIALLRLFIS
ncbi:MAG: AzlD domain-containing protein [Firmicutes bacterium]|nr:AzlD domain-containing protein [Bacillota bacterium]